MMDTPSARNAPPPVMDPPSSQTGLPTAASIAPPPRMFTPSTSGTGSFLLRPALSLPNLAEHLSINHRGTFSRAFLPPIQRNPPVELEFKVPASPGGRSRHLPVVPVASTPCSSRPQAKCQPKFQTSPIAGVPASICEHPATSNDDPAVSPRLLSPVARRTRNALEKKALGIPSVPPPPGFRRHAPTPPGMPPGFKSIIMPAAKQMPKSPPKHSTTVRENNSSRLRREANSLKASSSTDGSPSGQLSSVCSLGSPAFAASPTRVMLQLVDGLLGTIQPTATEIPSIPVVTAASSGGCSDVAPPVAATSSSSSDESDVPWFNTPLDPYPTPRTESDDSIPSFSADDIAPAVSGLQSEDPPSLPLVVEVHAERPSPTPEVLGSTATPEVLGSTATIGQPGTSVDQVTTPIVDVISLNASSSSSAFESPSPQRDSNRNDSSADSGREFQVVRNRRRRPRFRGSTANNGCPRVTSRVGNTLKFVFPLASPLKCTERKCSKEFVTKNWTSTKQSLIRHLEQAHQLSGLLTERWCSLCNVELPIRLSRHRCFQRVQYCPPHSEDMSHAFRCQECSFSCPSAGGLRNHIRSHLTPQAQSARDRHGQGGNNSNSPPANIPSSSASSPVDARPSSPEITDSSLPAGSTGAFAAEDDLDTSGAQPDAPVDPVPDPDAPAPSDPFLERLKVLHSDFSMEDWGAFEDLLEEFVTFAQGHVALPPLKVNSGPYKPGNPADPSFIQRLYRRNRGRAVRLITQGDSASCELSEDDLTRHFFPDSPPTCDLSLFDRTSPANSQPAMQPFSAEEVSSKLNQCENSAPGLDRLTYSHWKGVDPDGKALAVVFNLCLKARRIPSSWKTSKTIFLPKTEEPRSPNDWRPISLGSTIYKLFSSLLARRLSSWVEECGVLSPCQKGFRPFDGAFENNFVVCQRLQSARVLHKDLCLVSLDISNAFGSVPHAAVIKALSKAGAGDLVTDLISDLYTGSTTRLATSGGLSEEISISSGVKQGCPLSGLLFNITVDPILRAIQHGASSHRALAFADDILLIGNSPGEVQTEVNLACSMAEKIGLSVNPRKCFSLHLAAKPVRCLPTSFCVNGSAVPALEDSDPAPFLGKPIGFRLAQDCNTMDAHIEAARKIMSSFLAPWQRIDAMKTFFFPATAYQMRTDQFSKGQWKRLDNFIRPRLKSTLSLPPRAANEYLYGNTNDGLFGIPIATEDSDFALVDNAFKLLTSKDGRLQDLAWDDLHFCVQGRTRTRPTDEKLSDFLSGVRFGDSSNRISSVWTRARSASTRLGVTWSLLSDRTTSVSIMGKTITDRTKVM